MTGVFPWVLKTAKVVPVFKKDPNYVIATIAQYPCYERLKKFLKNLCIRNNIPFLIRIMLSITYSVDSGNSILHLIL